MKQNTQVKPDEGKFKKSFRARELEHGKIRAVLESFAYLPPFGAMFKKSSPFYAESYWYCMGGITFLMFHILNRKWYPAFLVRAILVAVEPSR